jgi:hypothetical protein
MGIRIACPKHIAAALASATQTIAT